MKAFAAEGGDGGRRRPAGRDLLRPDARRPRRQPRYELVELADNAPSVAEGDRAALHRAARTAAPAATARSGGADPRSLITPETWVRDYIQAQRNHYPELEEAAETLGGALNDPLSIAEPLRRRLKEAWGVEVRVVAPEMLDDASQHYDPQRRTLMLSSLLRPENRTFGIAYQLALLEFAPMHRAACSKRRGRPIAGSRRLLHMSFANYAAGAIMMPYGKLPRARPRSIATRSTGCAAQFGANVEQVAHRLTTLGRPGAQRRALLHAAGRPGREHLQALCRRELPLLALRRHLPALAPARRVPDAGPDDPPADRDARRPALLHHQPDDRAADPARPARRRAARDRARLRRQACAAHRLCRRPRPRRTRRRPRSAPPARSARACNAPIARRRRPAGCWRSRRTGRRFRPIPFVPA